MYKSVVYHGEELLGEVEVYLQQLSRDDGGGEEEEEESCYQSRKEKARMVEDVVKERVRVDHLSQPSERCPPLAVLHTVASCGICFKMESQSSLSPDSPLSLLHSSCTRDSKVYQHITMNFRNTQITEQQEFEKKKRREREKKKGKYP